jgi:ribosomal protein L39E
MTQVSYTQSHKPARLVVRDNEHVPHWVRAGRGLALIEFDVPDRADVPQWLSIDTEERGERSSKRTMVTLDEPAMRALYQHLKQRLEGDTP